jgi:hypothetical protein
MVLLWKKKLINSLSSLWASVMIFMGTKKISYAPVTNDGEIPKLPYGIAIAAGGIATIIMSAQGVTIWALFK